MLNVDYSSAVERIVEYLDLPQEPAPVIESSRPPAYWPSSESRDILVVEDLEVKYAAELPSVLRNLSFSLKAKEKIGLLGRTGTFRLLCLVKAGMLTLHRREREDDIGY